MCGSEVIGFSVQRKVFRSSRHPRSRRSRYGESQNLSRIGRGLLRVIPAEAGIQDLAPDL